MKDPLILSFEPAIPDTGLMNAIEARHAHGVKPA
jgi:hypothetical protein